MIMELLTAALKFGQALIGMKQNADIKQSGIDATHAADADAEVAALKAEQTAAAQPVDPAAALKDGKF